MTPPKILLDTNVLVSAVLFGGKPRKILSFVVKRQIQAATSPFLVSELSEVLKKKFGFSDKAIKFLERKIKKNFEVVYPEKNINVLQDKADNRVLEAAVDGKCKFIITGDKELLDLKQYKSVRILTPKEYLSNE